MVELMSFQENLRAKRKAAGFNATEFAKTAGIPYQTYISYENQGKEPRHKNLCKIAFLLNTSPNELLDFEDKSIWRKKFYEAQRQLDAIRKILGDEH